MARAQAAHRDGGRSARTIARGAAERQRGGGLSGAAEVGGRGEGLGAAAGGRSPKGKIGRSGGCLCGLRSAAAFPPLSTGKQRRHDRERSRLLPFVDRAYFGLFTATLAQQVLPR